MFRVHTRPGRALGLDFTRTYSQERGRLRLAEQLTTFASDTISRDSMNEYAVRVHAHHPYGDAMPKEQGVTASLAAWRFSRQGYSRMRLN